MGNFGLAPVAAQLTLRQLKFVERGWGESVNYFSKWPLMAEQSFNRYTREIFDMAAKAKKQIAARPTTRQEFQWKGFVNVTLTSEQKEAFAAWDVQDGDVWDGIAQYCEAGYKIALSYNSANSSYSCTGTGQPDCGANSGYAISAHAKSPYDAARVWLFKVATILPDVWSEHVPAESDLIG